MNEKRVDKVSEDESRPTLMHKLAHESRWSDLLERLTEKPEEALQTTDETLWMNESEAASLSSFQDSGKISPIHILCTRNGIPVTLLRAFLEAQPEAMQQESRDGRRALHFACYSQQPADVIQLLVEADPGALSCQDHLNGWNPFHICAHLPMGDTVLTTLLNVTNLSDLDLAATLQMKDKDGRIPAVVACMKISKISQSDFQMLYHATPVDCSVRSKMLQVLSDDNRGILSETIRLKRLPIGPFTRDEPSTFCNPSQTPPSSRSVRSPSHWTPEDTLIFWSCWSKMLTVLGVTDDNRTEHPLLHECIRLDRHSKTLFFECILRVNPFYACQMDMYLGDLPLHLVARHSENTTAWAYRLRQLLVVYPLATSFMNSNGELPLEILDEKRCFDWEPIHSVLKRCPYALSRLNLPESSFPDVLSKLNRAGDATSMFVMLKETPSLINHRPLLVVE